MEFSSPPQEASQKVLILHIQPDDILALCAVKNQVAADPTKIKTVFALPAQATLKEAYFQPIANWMGLILESEALEPTPVTLVDGKWSGPFPHTYLQIDRISVASLDEVDDNDDSPKENIDPTAFPPAPEFMVEIQKMFQSSGKAEFPVRAFTFKCADILAMLQNDNFEWNVPFFYEPDAHVIGVRKIQEDDLWVFWVTSSDFEPCKLFFEGEGPEKSVDIEIPSDGRSYTYRITLPGATATLTPKRKPRKKKEG